MQRCGEADGSSPELEMFVNKPLQTKPELGLGKGDSSCPWMAPMYVLGRCDDYQGVDLLTLCIGEGMFDAGLSQMHFGHD